MTWYCVGRAQRRCGLRGFTLAELLLVLALLVLMSAIAWPTLSRPLGTTKLREAARGLCNELARGRMRAIETGNVLVFRYAPNTGRYKLATRQATLERDEPATDPGLPNSTSANDERQRQWPAGKIEPVSGSLPGDIRFVGTAMDALFDGIRAPEANGSKSLPKTDSSSFPEPSRGDEAQSADVKNDDVLFEGDGVGQEWGETVYLFPDGTASDATIRLANEKGASIEITLRGMTGSTRLGNIVDE
jgi:prepilin-type N-terminal cleavage/methylation domain-containing protein